MHNFLEKLFGWLYPLLRKLSFGDTLSSYISLILNIIILCFLAYIIYVVFRLVLVTVMAVVAKKTKTNFDDLLVSNQTAKYLSLIHI
jgi:miniconductance mechanosensitive channel